GAGQSGGGSLGAGAPGGRLGAGQGPRAALPGRDGPGRPGGRGPQGPSAGNQTPSLFDHGAPSAPPQGRPAPAGAGFGQQQGPNAPQAAPPSGNQGQVPPQRGNAPERGRRPQLPPRGGARPELPGGDQQQRTPSWSDDNARPPAPRPSTDAPRGHDEPDVSRTAAMPRFDDRQGPGATAEIPRFDERQQAPGQDNGQYGRPGANGAANTGQFVRGDIFGAPQGGRPGAQDPAATGQFPAPQGYDNGTGQYPAPRQDNGSTGQFALPGRPGTDPSGTGQFERPRMNGTHAAGPVPPRPQPPQQQEQRQPSDQWALPPASGPGDGRTPLYDTLETNWFHGGQGGAQEQGNGSAPAAPQQPQQSPQPQSPTGSQRSNAAWRSSPNDELVKQAERVRKPAAGGVTTSGLPRRVPKANLVPGTAQQQNHQSGPQVSRAPDDVRGRLTNLRRGIAQGRQAGSSQTGSFPHPTHQQER
ncbi:nitrate- and nitrite sensing domain-containing protein, partial [Streptomyces althioticus]